MDHLEIVKYLIDKGANIHAFDDSALIETSEKGHFRCSFKYLVEKGATFMLLMMKP